MPLYEYKEVTLPCGLVAHGHPERPDQVGIDEYAAQGWRVHTLAIRGTHNDQAYFLLEREVRPTDTAGTADA